MRRVIKQTARYFVFKSHHFNFSHWIDPILVSNFGVVLCVKWGESLFIEALLKAAFCKDILWVDKPLNNSTSGFE